MGILIPQTQERGQPVCTLDGVEAFLSCHYAGVGLFSDITYQESPILL